MIAVERAGDLLMDIPASFALAEDDSLYVCGTTEAFDLFYSEFTDSDDE